jgi:transposase
LLVGRFRLSRRAAAELLSSAFGLPMSPATVQACCMRLSSALAQPTEELVDLLPGASALNLDETGWRQNGIRHWLWVAVASTFVVFAVHKRRSRAQPMSWLTKGFLGTVMSDRWSAYRFLDPAHRQVCWAHLLRDLLAIVEGGGSGSASAQTMLEGAWKMFHHWHTFEAREHPREQLHQLVADFRTQFFTFCEQGQAQKDDLRWRSLGRDLLKQWPSVFRFIDHDGLSPTNNAAERAIRAGVLWRRTSQGTRTDDGSLFVARILTTNATCKLQNRPIFDYLSLAANAWLHGNTAPSLINPLPVV